MAKIKNIYYMLSYAFQTLRETGFKNVGTESFENIHDLFAAILIRGVGAQVKRGLYREYVPYQEALAGLRGQIQIAQTIKQQTLPQGKLVCSYDEFTPDTPHNQALKSVMFLLLRQGNVKPENKKALRKLLLYFGDVTEIAPTSIRWDAFKYHKNNASYRMLLGICHLIVKGLLVTEESGGYRLTDWFKDEVMFRLYERFVRAYYQRHHPHFRPKAASIDWDIASNDNRAFLPSMKSDITLEYGDKRLIIDTKYYGKTMQVNTQYNSQKFISGNLYQIYTYVKNSDKNGTGNVAGVLLYAKTDESITPNEDFCIGGNQISLKTLDLNQNWEAITEQLEQLCVWLMA